MTISAHVQNGTKTIHIHVLQHIEAELVQKVSLYVKLWPRLKINRWQSFGVIKMYIMTGIWLFHRSVANCDRWVIYKSGQFHCLYRNICSVTDLLIKV